MRLVIVLLLFCISTSFYPAQNTVTQLAIERIQYIYLAKQTTGNLAWSLFGNERYNIPLLYYASNTTFVSNPGEKFLRQFHPQLIFENKAIRIYKLNFRIDGVPFHMQVSISYGKDTAAYDYNSPYIKCSSREEFEAVTGYHTSTQLWASMVLHECFHGFQFLHAGYRQHAIETGFMLPSIGDSLQQLYKSNAWFKASVDTENNLLLKAIRAPKGDETDSLVQQFLKVRNERRLRTMQESNLDIALLEKSFETLEGTARFIEVYALKNPIKDKALSMVDTSFSIHAADKFINALPEYFYKTEASDRYFYATGFNETRLLKKLNIQYISVLFKQPAVTLEDIFSNCKF